MPNPRTRPAPTQAEANTDTCSRLDSQREIQQRVTSPDICMGASKFMALKLIGFVRMERHLNDFFNSVWAALYHDEYPRSLLCNLWGGDLTTFNTRFNREILPVVINNELAGVKTEGEGGQLEYHYFGRSPGDADQLLAQDVPLVVAVTTGAASSTQDHHIVVARNTDGNIWAIDPWPGRNGVVNLSDPRAFRRPFSSFSKPFKVKLAIGEVTIPCLSGRTGFFRPPGEGMEGDYRYKVRLAL